MAGLIEQILGLATIEQIEAEQVTHRAAIVESQKQLDALDQVLRILIVARDGKPPRKARKPRESTEDEPVSDDDIDEQPAEEDDDSGEDEALDLTVNQRAVLDVIKRGPITNGDIAHKIKIPYGTVYSAVQKLLDQKLIVKSGDKLALKV